MNIEIWWIWMILAAVLLIAELFTAGFFLIWFSIGAAAAGILALLEVGRPAQLVVFMIVSGILFVFGRRFAEQVTQKQPPGIGADRFLGKIGTVIEIIDNKANTGRVRIDQDVWRANSDTGDIIREGEQVEVVRVDGTRAIVITLKEKEE